MKEKYKTLFLTERALVHQKLALDAAPDNLSITMLQGAAAGDIAREISDADFLISEREGEIDRPLLEKAKALKMIVRLGSRTWDIDTEAASGLGIRVCKLPLDSCVHVAEHVMMQALALSRRVRESMSVMVETDWSGDAEKCTEDRFAYNWSGRTGVRQLKGSVFGILGFGEIGTELALRLKGFGCRILYNKRKMLPREAEQSLGVEYSDRDALVRESDFICSLLPFFDETGPTIGDGFFSSMKDGSFFIHCGGSGVVHEEDVISALESGKLAGAALDTFSWEPVRRDEPILELSRNFRVNLILTPHIAAGGTSLVKANSRKAYYEDITRFLEGRPLLNVVM